MEEKREGMYLVRLLGSGVKSRLLFIVLIVLILILLVVLVLLIVLLKFCQLKLKVFVTRLLAFLEIRDFVCIKKNAYLIFLVIILLSLGICRCSACM